MRVARALFLTLAALCLAWVVTLLFTGGSDLELLGRVIRTHDARRPLLFGSIALTAFILAGGAFPPRLRGLKALVRERIRIDDRWVGGALAAATLGFAISYSTMAIGGSDSYGYVSEAELMYHGKLTQPQPWVAAAPWPAARWSFTPLGYRPEDGPDRWDIVPTYAPGLPLLMAGARLIAGYCGVFLVVPVLGSVLVLSTFGIGRRLGSSRAGLVAAWLVATSPAFLYMVLTPMSDVAVAGAWAAAFYFLLGSNVRQAAAAGGLSAIAILIRPNLFFVAGIMGLLHVWRAWRNDDDARRRHVGHALVFGACAAAGMLSIAGLNWWIRGNPLESGYGGLNGMFAVSHIWPNVTRYASYLFDSQTVFAFAGLAALFVPLKRLWPGLTDRSALVVAALVVFSIAAEYSAFLVFDAWWYLRFFLPCWPFMMLGIGSLAVAGARMGRPVMTVAVTAAVVGLGVYGLRFADRRHAFELYKSDHRFVAAALIARDATDANSVILSMQHSGSIRYYGGRMTLRFDGLEPGAYDTAMTWLPAHGVHPYALLEDWEVDAVKKRFEGQKLVRAFDAPPAVIYLGSTTSYLYDLLRPVDPQAPTTTIVETYTGARCQSPAPPPVLTFRDVK